MNCADAIAPCWLQPWLLVGVGMCAAVWIYCVLKYIQLRILTQDLNYAYNRLDVLLDSDADQWTTEDLAKEVTEIEQALEAIKIRQHLTPFEPEAWRRVW